MGYRIKNWGTYQHYSDKRAPWIKMYPDLTRDFEFRNLPERVALRLIFVWLSAPQFKSSIKEEPVLPESPAALSLAASIDITQKDVNLMVSSGFLIPETPSRQTLDLRYGEGEGEGEGERDKEGRSAPPPDPEKAVNKEGHLVAKATLDYWHKRWVEKTGAKPAVSGARDMAILKKLTAGRSFNECRFVVDQLYDFPPRKNGEPIPPTMTNLAYNWNNLLYRMREGTYERG